MIARAISRLASHVARRVRLIARRGIVKLIHDDPRMQELQLAILAGEVRDRVERWQDYGITSHPHPGAEALVLALGGNSDHSVAVKVDDRRYRLVGLAQGEMALYDDQGQVVHLKRGKEIHVYGCDKLTADVGAETVVTCPLVRAVAESKVELTTPLVECSADVQIGGNLVVQGAGTVSGALSSTTSIADPTGTMQAVRDIYNTHTHPENDQGGPTGQPNEQMV